MIAVRGLTVALGGRTVLHDVSLAVTRGEFLAVCGPNGAGKSTLLRALAGLAPGGTPRPRDLAYVEQGARAAWPLRAADVVALGRLPHGDRSAPAIARALDLCGAARFADRRVDTLSGGEARRVMLARALATEAPALLLDEPVADLDPAAAHAIMALLARLAAEGRAIVAVLHDIQLALRYATRMIVLADGRIAADAPPLAALPAAAAAFGMAHDALDGVGLVPPP